MLVARPRSGRPLPLLRMARDMCADRRGVLLTRELMEAQGILLHFHLGAREQDFTSFKTSGR